MTTPPSKLLPRLYLFPNETIEVRYADGRLESSVSKTDAMALVIQGVVEGVGPRSGVLRFLRYLKCDAQPAAERPGAVAQQERIYKSHSGPIAVTNMGAYLESLSNPNGVTHCWAHCAHKGGTL